MVTLLKEQFPETVVICYSRRKRDIAVIAEVIQKEMNLNPGRTSCGRCPLPVRSCSEDRCLRLKLFYKKGEDVVRIESSASDFEFCADPDESERWSILEAADCLDVGEFSSTMFPQISPYVLEYTSSLFILK